MKSVDRSEVVYASRSLLPCKGCGSYISNLHGIMWHHWVMIVCIQLICSYVSGNYHVSWQNKRHIHRGPLPHCSDPIEINQYSSSFTPLSLSLLSSLFNLFSFYRPLTALTFICVPILIIHVIASLSLSLGHPTVLLTLAHTVMQNPTRRRPLLLLSGPNSKEDAPLHMDNQSYCSQLFWSSRVPRMT